MNVDLAALLDAPDWPRAQRTLAACRFAAPVEFREAMADLCRILACPFPLARPKGLRNGGNRLGSWRTFVRREFERDVREVPEAAILSAFASWIGRLKRAEEEVQAAKRRASAKKGQETRKKKLGTHADDWQAGRRRIR